MPSGAIQRCSSTSWNPPSPTRKSAIIPTASASATREDPRATRLASSSWPLGTAATASTPISGTTPISVIQGRLSGSTSGPHEEQGSDQQGGTAEHAERVRADEAGLDAAQPAGRAADECGDPVDRAVDAATVDE